MIDQQVAFLAQGKLHWRTNGGELKVVDSVFGRSLRDRAAQIHNRHAWKTKGMGAQFLAGGRCSGPECDPGEFRVWITSVCPGREPGGLFYTLETDEVGGIFAVDPAGVEQRLFHTADFRIRHIAISTDRHEVAASVIHPNASSNIAVMKSEGTDFRELTEGESMDIAPSWAPGGRRRIVFQSSGIGRDASGRFSGLSPSAIQMLDLESGDLTMLAEEAGHDLLGPRMMSDGSLLYIRRPYETGVARIAPLHALKDAALFPFRLFHAIFQYFNFFSMRYGGKPLITSHGAAQRQPDLKQMMIWGNLIDSDRIMRAGAREDSDAPAMVPSSWQLVRRAPGGSTEILAKSVLSFDAAANGDVHYSNGSAIYRIANGAHSAERVLVSKMIEQVASLG